MFGLDEAELARRSRPPRRLRPWVVLVLLVLGGVASIPFAVIDAIYRPGALQPWLDRAFVGAPFRLLVGDVTLLPVGAWRHPSTWRLGVQGLDFRPTDPKKVSWSARYVSAGLWASRNPEGRWIIDLDGGVVTGLAIVAHQQRPPPPWTPVSGPIALLRASSIVLREASFEAPEDPPLGVVETRGLVGVLRNLRFDPGARELWAEGSVKGDAFRTGAVTVTDLDLDVFRIVRSSLHIEGRFQFAGAPGTLIGDIERFHIRSKVTLNVAMADLSLQDAVKTATGRSSPMDGRLGVRLKVRAGGDLPRGGSIMEGEGTLRQGKIQLGPRTRYVVLDLIRLAPWVDLDMQHRVVLRDLKGQFRFKRGEVAVADLTYPVGKRTLRLDGTLSSGRFRAMVRILPKVLDSGRPGLGVLLEGGKDAELEVRIVERGDIAPDGGLLPEPAPTPAPTPE